MLMNSKRLLTVVFVLALVLMYGSSTDEGPAAQTQAARSQSSLSIPGPPDFLVVWFNQEGRVFRAQNGRGVEAQPREWKTLKELPPKHRIVNNVTILQGSHCVWDQGVLWC
jgi:hypothetical protein